MKPPGKKAVTWADEAGAPLVRSVTFTPSNDEEAGIDRRRPVHLTPTTKRSVTELIETAQRSARKASRKPHGAQLATTILRAMAGLSMAQKKLEKTRHFFDAYKTFKLYKRLKKLAKRDGAA